MSTTLTPAETETLCAIAEAAQPGLLVTGRTVADCSPGLPVQAREHALRSLRDRHMIDRGPLGLRLTAAGRAYAQAL